MPTRISAGVGDHPCFLTFYNYDPYRLLIFPYTCIGIMKVRGFWPKILLQNQLNIYILTVGQYCLGIAKPKNVFRLILSPFIK